MASCSRTLVWMTSRRGISERSTQTWVEALCYWRSAVLTMFHIRPFRGSEKSTYSVCGMNFWRLVCSKSNNPNNSEAQHTVSLNGHNSSE